MCNSVFQFLKVSLGYISRYGISEKWQDCFVMDYYVDKQN